MSFSLAQILLFTIAYLTGLFLVAHLADRGLIPRRITHHPAVYVLSLAVFAGVAPGWVWWATLIFLIGRVGHWLFYSLRLPVLRTASFAAGSFAMLALSVMSVLSAFG